MRRATSGLIATIILISQGHLIAEQENLATPIIPIENSKSSVPFQPFTGKVTKSKVRLRTQPNLDSPIIKEVSRDDLFVVTGEVEDFYAVQPPEGTKAYVFRTFVLEGVVEGSRVNIRLFPDLDAPVIGQLNSGDRVQGTVSKENNKWLEIPAPSNTHFYLAKEYILNIGGPDLLSKMEKRHDNVTKTLKSAAQMTELELRKPFEQIQLEGYITGLNNLIKNNADDYPEEVAEAKELLAKINEAYIQKKIAYLENKAQSMSQPKESPPPVIEKPQTPLIASNSPWTPIENALFAQWAAHQRPERRSREDYYRSQTENAVTLKGVVEPYQRAVKNKPGDYILINNFNNLPVAYLYSTHVDLHDYIGKEISIVASERPNNNFAYPAYYVLTIE